MSHWLSVALALLTAAMVGLDARAVGPYFAFYELIPGMGITEAIFHGEEKPLRLAILRRFGYGFLLGLVLTFVFGADFPDASLAGGLAGLLLIWPITVQGLPTWAAPVRVLLILYVAVVLAFGAASALGYLFVTLVAEGDLVAWIQLEGIQFLGSVVIAAFALTAIGLVGRPRQ